jgi:hypothetical protein
MAWVIRSNARLQMQMNLTHKRNKDQTLELQKNSNKKELVIPIQKHK